MEKAMVNQGVERILFPVVVNIDDQEFVLTESEAEQLLHDLQVTLMELDQSWVSKLEEELRVEQESGFEGASFQIGA